MNMLFQWLTRSHSQFASTQVLDLS